MRANPFVIVVLTLLATSAGVLQGFAQEVEIPPVIDYISDYADIVDQPTEEELHSLITELEEETGARVMVLTVNSVEPLEISDYGSRVTDTWQLRTKDALLIVALEDGKVYLDVGKRLKKVFPDERLQEVLDKQILPHFNEGNFSQGICEGVATMASVIRESLPRKQVLPLTPSLIAISLAILAVVVIMLVL